MLEVLIPALIAAIVSFLVAWLTMRSQREQQKQELQAQKEHLEQELQAERQRQERELERRFTEKLYNLRLDSYPEAFAITDQLRGEFIFHGELTKEMLSNVRTNLQDWTTSKAGFLLSRNSLQTFYELRNALNMQPEYNGKYAEDQKKKIWRGKNQFRKALKLDVGLLYAEENESS